MLFDILSKQAQIILSADSLNDIDKMSLCSEQQAEHIKLINKCQDNKRILYEQYVMKKIGDIQYKNMKVELDEKLSQLNHTFADLSAKSAKVKANYEEKSKVNEIASDISEKSGLAQAIVDLLIDKVYVYPDNRIEIFWKVTDFLDFQNRREREGEEIKSNCLLSCG